MNKSKCVKCQKEIKSGKKCEACKHKGIYNIKKVVKVGGSASVLVLVKIIPKIAKGLFTSRIK